MRKLVSILSLAAVLSLFLSTGAAYAAPGVVQFCKDLTDKFEPIAPGGEFTGSSVSWLASSPEPFGKPSIVISIYRDSNGSQSLLLRRDLDVNPAWDNVGLRNMPIEEPGRYTITLSQADGTEIATGSVTILASKNDEPAKPEEIVGGTLKELFNKYAPKK